MIQVGDKTLQIDVKRVAFDNNLLNLIRVVYKILNRHLWWPMVTLIFVRNVSNGKACLASRFFTLKGNKQMYCEKSPC